MKSDEAVFAELEGDKNNCVDGSPVTPRFMIAGEAPILLSKACELLVKEVTVRAWRHTERNRRRTLQKQDVQAAVGESEVYDFLIDIVPRVQLNQGKHFSTGTIPGPSTTQLPENVVTIDQASLIVRGGETATAKQETDMNLIHLQQMQYNIMLQQQHQQQHHQQQVKHDQNIAQSHNHQVATTSQQQQQHQTGSQHEQQMQIDNANNIDEVQTVNLNDLSQSPHTILTHQLQCTNQFAQNQEGEGSQLMPNHLTQTPTQTATKQQSDQLQVQHQNDQGQIHSESEQPLYIPPIHYLSQHGQQNDCHLKSNHQKVSDNQEVDSNK